MIMELILHKKDLHDSGMQRHWGGAKKCLSAQKVNDWLPKNRRIDGLGIFIFPFNGIRGWRQNEWKLYPEKQCETRPSGI